MKTVAKTVVQALSCFCPHKMSNANLPQIGRGVLCEADNCMFWRWERDMRPKEQRGFCGVAGAPE